MSREIKTFTVREFTKTNVMQTSDYVIPGKKLPWLQKFLIRCLERLDCKWKHFTSEVQKHEIDVQDFLAQILKQAEEIRYIYQNREQGEYPVTVLIGDPQYREITGNVDIKRHITITGKKAPGIQLMNMEVHVLPHLDGIVVVPDYILAHHGWSQPRVKGITMNGDLI